MLGRPWYGEYQVADEALRRISGLYKVEARVRGSSPEHRLAIRKAESAPTARPSEQPSPSQCKRRVALARSADIRSYLARK
jgi:hypothetical protein